MKLTPALLAASLALNAALLGLVVYSRVKSPPAHARPSTGQPVDALDATPASAGNTASTPSPAALAATLSSGDHAALRDQLRALGLSETMVRNIVQAMIWQPYRERELQINAAKLVDDQPYWRGLRRTGRRAYTREEREELRHLASDIRQKVEEVLGTSAIDGISPQARRYSFLSADAAARIADIDRDYGEMLQEISQEAERFRVPSDAEKQRFLSQERLKDIEAALTPDEYREFELRHSPAAQALRNRLTQIEVTEAEYRALFEIQKTLFDNAPVSSPANAPTDERRALQEKILALHDDIRTTLGDERYAQFMRASNSEYRQLQAAADRFALPTETINRVYGYRHDIASASQRIATDETLSLDQKKDALSSLAVETRQKISADLGDEIAEAYLARNMRWLESVKNGQVLTLRPDGNNVAMKPLPRRAPPPPATP